ncbi:hypothetical protein AVEN_107301-1 [Araneus ventricosus]|uniref:Inner centromere protein ARK-binding domain-containing protein n=1 Tax=Araneus ventricosus TaxID=182803 RepID=A0A4Y2DU75_ARAVE|nr:hypothetical protein AVEN_107301-1 [Araneus ventricosus]
MKIHKELLELSRKADKIIHSSIEFNLDILKSFKEKALEIMACKTLEDLKKLSKATEPEKKFKKFDIPSVESKVHLHSNKSSFASTSEFFDQNNADNSSELEKEENSNCKKSSNSSHANNGEKLLADNRNSEDGTLQKETNKRDEFVAKNIDSETSQQNSNTKNSKESNSQNFVKINNFHFSVQTSSESSTSKHIDGIYPTTNFVFETHRNIDIMEKIEESDEEIISKKFVTVSTLIKTSYAKSSENSGNSEEILQNERDACDDNSYSSNDIFKNLHHGLPDINIVEKIEKNDEGIISQKFVTVSTMIKTSYSKSSNENYEEIMQIERDAYDENSNSGDDNFKELQHGLPVGMLQLNVESTYDTDNIQSNEILPNENFILPPSEVNCNTDFAVSNDPGLMKTNSDNIMPQNFQFVECNGENQLDICNLNFRNQEIRGIHSNVSDNETQFPPTVPCSLERIVEDLQNIDDTKTKISGNFLVSSRVLVDGEATDSNTSDNLKSGIVSETDGHVNSIRAKDNAEINDKKKKFSKKKNILAKNFQGISAIPVLIENKEPDALNSKKLFADAIIKSKFKGKRSPLSKNSRNYNLRSSKNNPTAKTYNEKWKTCSKLEFKKSLTLKEKVEEKKRIREQKMKLTRERRENLEKARRERLRLSEERRIKRFEQHEEILKRKIMDVKNKTKCRKLSKQFTNSSEVSPEGNVEPQSLQTGLNRTYLVENLKDISPIEPAENTKDRSSGEGLNYSLLYNSAYDKKFFMRQSVVLTDIAQLMPSGTIQNCLNFSQNKEIKPIFNKTPNSTPPHKVGKRKLSSVNKKNSSSAPIKKLMRSTRKISVSPNNIQRDEAGKEERNTEKGVGISDSLILKLPSQQIAKAKDNSAMTAKLRSDPKLSMETCIVLENLSKHKNEEPIYSEIKTSNEATKVKAVTLSIKTISSDPKLSALSPVVVLKDISNIKSNHSRLTDVKSKTAKVSVLDNGFENYPKLSILKPGVVLKNVINSKSCIQIEGKKLEKNIKKEPNKYKRKAQGRLHNNKPRKKLLVTNKASENQNKRSSSFPKKNQSSDITSYEISDISDNSIKIIEPKPKKIPSWATNIHLKQAILKQHYEPQDADAIFGIFKNQKAIDLAEMFTPDKPQYHNRTSSAKWSADESPI